MSQIQRTLILAGHFADQTIKLGRHQFVDGRLNLDGPKADVDGITRYLNRCYQAWPEGSPELEVKDDGKCDPALPREDSVDNAVSGDSEPAVDRSEEEAAPVGVGDATPEAGNPGLEADGAGVEVDDEEDRK